MTRAIGAGLLWLILATDPAARPFAGQPLVEALNLLEARGLSLIYSSELVRPELRVVREPRAGSPREVLEQILAPHSLGVRSGPGGRLLVVPLPHAIADTPGEQIPPTFPAAVDLVTMDAVVLDASGEPVVDLRAEDFTVHEDGVLQRISSFEAVTVPEAGAHALAARRPRASTNELAGEVSRRFVVVFDEVHMSPLQAEHAKEVLAGFLRNGLREGDQVTIVPTGGGGWWNGRMIGAGRDLAAFLKHLKGLRPAETSTCALGEYDAALFYHRRDPGAESRLMRWLNECNPTLDPPVVQSDTRVTVDGRVRTESLREARTRRTQLDISPGRGQLKAAAADVYERANLRRRRTLESLTRTLEGLALLRGRKVVLLVSEGFIDEAGLTELQSVAQASLRASAAVFFLDARGDTLPVTHVGEAARLPEGRDATGFLDAQGHLDDGAESVAALTGGVTLRGDLATSWRRVAEESRAYYLLGYHPTNSSRDGRLRKVEIGVARPGMKVRARPGYYAPSESQATQPEQGLRAAMDLAVPGGSLSLRLAAFILGPGEQARSRTLLVAEAETRGLGLRESDGRLVGELEALALVVSRETGAVSPLAHRIDISLPAEGPVPGWLGIPREFELQPGTYQARVVVRGPDGRVGAVEHEFAVPPSGLRISTPVLTDVLNANGRPTPTARTRFPPTGRLFCQFEVHGATRDPQSGAPRVSARHALRRSDGSVVSESGFTPLAVEVGAAPARMFAISLQGGAPGRYDLTLEARDEVSGQTREVQESYVVEPDEQDSPS